MKERNTDDLKAWKINNIVLGVHRTYKIFLGLKGSAAMKKFVSVLTGICLYTVFLLGLFQHWQEYRISDGNRINFGHLLSDLLDAYENNTASENERLIFDLETIKAVSPRDYAVAKSITEHWKKVYLDHEYKLIMYSGEGTAPELNDSGIPDSSAHAFIILGYELRDGEMTEELKGRCDAAAAAAKEFPNTILVCSGGATGANNPEHHTEAGIMKDYLSNQCGISSERIFTDERAMTTAENAVNTLAILNKQAVRSMTIVTSAYHQQWGQVLYNAVSAIYRQQYGFGPEIISNYCYNVSPENGMIGDTAGIAIHQLSSILGISKQAMK